MPLLPPPGTRQAGGTHPTGMLTCFMITIAIPIHVIERNRNLSHSRTHSSSTNHM